MVRYYILRRGMYDESVEVGFIDCETTDEMNRIVDEIDESPMLGSLSVFSEAEFASLKQVIKSNSLIDWND